MQHPNLPESEYQGACRMPRDRQWIERTGCTVVKEGIWLSRTGLSGRLMVDSGTLVQVVWPAFKQLTHIDKL